MGLFSTTKLVQRVCCLFILLGANTYGSTLLVLGDSLSAGYGVNQESGWVALLADDFTEQITADNSVMLDTYDQLQINVINLKVDMLQKLNINVDYVDADGD